MALCFRKKIQKLKNQHNGDIMKLYYSAGACSMSSHIVLNEAGFECEFEAVDLKTKVTATGKDFYAINEQGTVPFLVLDNGETITEGVAIVQYLAEQKPESGLTPAAGTMERVRLQEWLNYISTEIHKAHVPLFKAEYPQEAKEIALNNVKKAYDHVSKKLGDKPYLLGDKFTVADSYLFTVLNWHNWVNIDLSPWSKLVEYQKGISARPAVQKTMEQEGLLGKKAA
jgi:glutathione S-transferase